MINSSDAYAVLNISADDQALETARAFVLQQAEALELPASSIFKLELALEEIVVNVAHYAYPKDAPGLVEIGCATDANGLTVRIADSGKPFNPLEKETPDLNLDIEDRQIGGLGIFLTREMVDDIQYRRENDRNIIAFLIRKP